MFDLSSPPTALEKPSHPEEPADLFDEAAVSNILSVERPSLPTEPTHNAMPVSAEVLSDVQEPLPPIQPPNEIPPVEVFLAEPTPVETLEKPTPEATSTTPEVAPAEGTEAVTPDVEKIAFDSTRDEPEIQKMVRDTLGASETNEVLQAALVRVLMQVSLTAQSAELLGQLRAATIAFSQTPEDGFFLEAVCTRLVQAFRTTYQRS